MSYIIRIQRLIYVEVVMSNEQNAIAIVGAGYCGTLLAVHLLRKTTKALTVYLIERNPEQYGKGVAYSTPAACHLLNVPAANMSAFPDDPRHFFTWAQQNEKKLLHSPWVTEIVPNAFLPRRSYGDYLYQILEEAEKTAPAGVRLQRVIDEAVGVRVDANGVDLQFSSGEKLHADHLVLALGNFPPGNPRVTDPDFYKSARYQGNPWSAQAYAAVRNTESCLLIGSGLTMADWCMNLKEAGYAGTIHVLSRRGLWPKAHRLGPLANFSINSDQRHPTLRNWLHALREYIRGSGCNWRSVVDALRPSSQQLWKALSVAEQRRFLRHLRPYWDLHRHRLAPQIADQLDALLQSGRLVRHVGRILDYQMTGGRVAVTVKVRNALENERFLVDAVVNCAGSESDYRRLDQPLIMNLLAQQLVCSDALALGLVTDTDGALIDAQGIVSSKLYTLGPPQKGMLWESTAVPELRVQAMNLAHVLLAAIGDSRFQ